MILQPEIDGVASAARFICAISVAVVLAKMGTLPPIVPAFAASLVLAGLEWVSGALSPPVVPKLTAQELATWCVDFLGSFAVLKLFALMSPSGALFVCEPLVPWGISIAIFGAFVSTWVGAGTRARASDVKYRPLIRLMLFWVAPFYGFFHAPWFLAQSLAIRCDGRSTAELLVVTVAMVLSAIGGASVGAWMFDRRT